MAVHSQIDHLASPRQMVTPSIRLENVSAGYWRDEPVLEDLCADIQGPGMFHLAGPNGVGKSTLFEVIAGYLETCAGRVEVGGQPVRAGYLVTGLNLTRSDPVFVPGVSVSDHLHLYARRYGADIKAAHQLAAQLGLKDHLDKPPEALSTGTARKAWFVCHAASPHPIWCIDEPFNGVDIESAATMAKILVTQSASSLVLITSHLLPECLRTVDTPATISPPLHLAAIADD